jgi:mono/diheme cytochrome c family protein
MQEIKARGVAAVALVVAGVATSAGTGATSLAVAVNERGHSDFITYCAACHGVTGKGDGSVAEFLTIPAADLTQLARKNHNEFPRERARSVIDGRAQVRAHGPRDMPVWGDWFTMEAKSNGVLVENREVVVSARINDLVDYLASIQER